MKNTEKTKKFNLDELKVQSFVTEFDKEQRQTLEFLGGGTQNIYCCSGDGRCFSDSGMQCGNTLSSGSCTTC